MSCGHCSATLRRREIVTDETLFREMREHFGSPFGYGTYFRGRHGRRGHPRAAGSGGPARRKPLLREIIRTSKGQKQSRAVKRLKVVEGFLR